MDISAPLTELKGVGEKTEKLFQKIGVYTVGDILLHFPRTYLQYPALTDMENIKTEETVAVAVRLKTAAKLRRGRNMDVVLATAFAGDVPIQLIWFRMPYMARQLAVGTTIVLYGRLTTEERGYKMEQPVVFDPQTYESRRQCLQPIYALTKSLSNQTVKKTVRTALDGLDFDENDLPVDIVAREHFPSHREAMEQIHFPIDFEHLRKARSRLVYKEFFYFILYAAMQKSKFAAAANPCQLHEGDMVERALAKLPFQLTKGQWEALADIRRDFRGKTVSQRLLQGDVGSGKTIVAFLAMLDMAQSGYQSAIMAPTEVLAIQHYQTFQAYCKQMELEIPMVCLTGSMTAAQKKECYKKIVSTPGMMIIGTHALIQEKVTYEQLAFVITDEQHRFGVKQRESLAQKGITPHMLVMSATPIPRTLAMILYSNMNISIITGMPKNRLPIKTCVIGGNMRKKAYDFLKNEIQKGHQAYIICPLVEASETTEAENVTDYVKKLRESFDETVQIAALHGKMKAQEKNDIMHAFAENEIQILASTTVVEVGVNVPNATVMMIENANRFGLAQLHQLRGRVGRGKSQSYCILMDDANGKNPSERLQIMLQSNDGFYIANEDLHMRGPGDFFGIRQSGDFQFRLADIIQDASLIQAASEDVRRLLEEDDNLSRHPSVRKNLEDYARAGSYIL